MRRVGRVFGSRQDERSSHENLHSRRHGRPRQSARPAARCTRPRSGRDDEERIEAGPGAQPGSAPSRADALDPDAVAQAVGPPSPNVIVHQLTPLSGRQSARAAARSSNRSRRGRDWSRRRGAAEEGAVDAGGLDGSSTPMAATPAAWPLGAGSGSLERHDGGLRECPSFAREWGSVRERGGVPSGRALLGNPMRRSPRVCVRRSRPCVGASRVLVVRAALSVSCRAGVDSHLDRCLAAGSLEHRRAQSAAGRAGRFHEGRLFLLEGGNGCAAVG